MKWYPRSLVGQLFVLLLLAMTITHLIAIFMPARLYTTKQVHALSAREIEIRVASAYRAVVKYPVQANSLISELSLPESLFELAQPTPGVFPEMDDQEAALAQRLRKRLQLSNDTPVQVTIRRVNELPPARDLSNRPNDFPDSGEAWVMDIELGLPDGSILHSRHWPAMMSNKLAGILRLSIPIGLLPLLVIAIFFGRRTMRQLQVLTDAARKIRRGERIDRVPAEGPDDIREVIEAFNDMQDHLMRYVSDRTRMLAAIGHDLRTPLTSLRIRAELIGQDDLRDAMVQTVDEMSAMIDETLRFAQGEATQEPTQVVDLGQLVQDVVKHQRALGRQLTCHTPAHERYRCRPIHLKRALNNLIDNAARYGRVSVRVWPTAGDQGPRIEIDDQGPGIAPDKVELAFEPFMRLDAGRNHETGGTGLGLANARSCIRAHGGEVSLHNLPEGGLRALIVLPPDLSLT